MIRFNDYMRDGGVMEHPLVNSSNEDFEHNLLLMTITQLEELKEKVRCLFILWAEHLFVDSILEGRERLIEDTIERIRRALPIAQVGGFAAPATVSVVAIAGVKRSNPETQKPATRREGIASLTPGQRKAARKAEKRRERRANLTSGQRKAEAAKKAAADKERWKDPAYKAKRNDSAYKARQAAAQRARSQDPAYKAKKAEKDRVRRQDPVYKAKAKKARQRV